VNNPRAHPVVHLSDGKIYEYARLAAVEIGGTEVELPEAIYKSSFHRGYQFMLYSESVKAARPSKR
jgi:hypothetical protein